MRTEDTYISLGILLETGSLSSGNCLKQEPQNWEQSRAGVNTGQAQCMEIAGSP